MSIAVLTKQHERLGSLDAPAADALLDPASHTAILADVLLDLYRRGVWLGCGCGCVFHVRGGVTVQVV